MKPRIGGPTIFGNAATRCSLTVSSKTRGVAAMTTIMRTLLKLLLTEQIVIRSRRDTLHTMNHNIGNDNCDSAPFPRPGTKTHCHILQKYRGRLRWTLKHLSTYHSTCCNLRSSQKLSEPMLFRLESTRYPPTSNVHCHYNRHSVVLRILNVVVVLEFESD